jgi:hypothetical protein
MKAYGTTLHVNDGMVSVLPGRCSRQAQDVFSFDFAKHTLESESREMVALVDNDVAILGYKIMNYTLAPQAWDYSDIDHPRSLPFSSPKLPDVAAMLGIWAGRASAHDPQAKFQLQRKGLEHREPSASVCATLGLIMRSEDLAKRLHHYSAFEGCWIPK